MLTHNNKKLAPVVQTSFFHNGPKGLYESSNQSQFVKIVYVTFQVKKKKKKRILGFFLL